MANEASDLLWRVLTVDKGQPLLLIRAWDAVITNLNTLKLVREDGSIVLALNAGEWRSVTPVENGAQNGEKEKR